MTISNEPLTNEQLEQLAPSLFADEPYFEASDKYHFVSTIDVINEIRDYAWYPVGVSEANVRDEFLNPGENVVELLLFNSHDRSKCFSISAGVFRFVCANGLVVSDEVFESYQIKHLGDKENDVSIAINKIAKAKYDILDKIKLFSKIPLTQDDKASFAKAAIPLRFEKHLEVDYRDLLVPHRIEDKKDDLYTTFNTIQEHLIRGNISGINAETNRRFTSRIIKSISTDTDINKKLWNMAESIAKIKATQNKLIA